MGEIKKVRKNDHNRMSNLIVDNERSLTLDQAINEVKEGQIKELNTPASKNKQG